MCLVTKNIYSVGEPSIVYETKGGVIAFYPESKGFLAVCECGGHEGKMLCRRWRSCEESKRNKHAGRPLGELRLWLETGENHGDREAHMADKCLAWELRVERRAELGNDPVGQELLTKERPKKTNEGDEPIGLG